MEHLLHFGTRFPGRTLFEHALRTASSVGDATPPATVLAIGPAVQARVEHGRWIGDCPTFGCNGAEFVNLDDEQPAFFCTECRNSEHGNQPLPVLLPAPDTLHDIERYLRSRPAPATRNWLPSESVTDLRDENRAHNIKLIRED